MKNTYPEPAPLIESLTVESSDSGPFKMKATTGNGPSVSVEVQFYSGIGWSVEARYDLAFKDFQRQPYTGAQEFLEQERLLPEIHDDRISLEAGGTRLSFSTRGGAFMLSESNADLFRSAAAPFSVHKDSVTLFEDVISLKVTDMEQRMGSAREKKTHDSHMVRFQYPRPQGTVLGLAGQAGEMNRNGYRFELYNTDTVCLMLPDRRPLYQSWPVLFHRSLDGKQWMAVFNDNPSRTFVDIGDFYPDRVTFESTYNNSRVMLISAPSLSKVSQKLLRFLGGTCEVPEWALGYQQCRWSYMDSNEIRSVAKRLRAENIPCDAIYYDIDHMDDFRVFTKEPDKFSDLAECIEDVRELGFKSVAIVDPGVKIDQDFNVYQAMKEVPCLKNQDGSDFEAIVWPGKSILPDFGSSQTREVWSDLERDWLQEFKFDGIWNDMNEPSNFDGQNRSTAQAMNARGSHATEHNLYGLWMARASHEGWKKYKPEEKSLIITRAGYPGVQKDAVIWHGDNQSWWEHLRLAIDMTISFSLSGAHYNGPDVPGFSGSVSEDLAVRFFQLGAFLPLFRGHSIYYARDKEPYAFSERTVSYIRKAINLRYSLAREWHTGMAFSRLTQKPPIQPIFCNDHLVRDQFLLFDKFLIAPVIERDQQLKLIYLPEGSWYRLGDTTKKIEGKNWIQVETPLSDIPVFVKAGSIVVTAEPKYNISETFKGEEKYEVYADSAQMAEGLWYGRENESDSNNSFYRIFKSPESENARRAVAPSLKLD